MADDEMLYDVGYGKPPKDKRFPKGRSGNPKGRPKGSVSMATLFHRTMNEKVEVTEGNRQKKKTLGELVIIKMFHKAASGDPRARHDVMNCLQIFRPNEDAGDSTERQTSERKLFENFVERFSRLAPKAVTSPEESEEISNVWRP